MNTFVDQRGGYRVTCYTINVTENMKKNALEFSKAIILTGNQYSRLLPRDIRESGNVGLQQKLEIQRTYMGKLGELAFLDLLRNKGKNVCIDGMFDIFEGQSNVDSFDFVTKSRYSVDVKAGFRKIHTRLLVNAEQLNHIPKDYYVAVKLNAIDTNPHDKLVDWDNIDTATILGFADYDYIKHHAEVFNFGEGPAYWLYYDRLMGIDSLLKEF